jgi:hypothetical protein
MTWATHPSRSTPQRPVALADGHPHPVPNGIVRFTAEHLPGAKNHVTPSALKQPSRRPVRAAPFGQYGHDAPRHPVVDCVDVWDCSSTPQAVALRAWLLLMESSSVVSLADIAPSPGEAGGRSGRGSLFQLVRTRSEVSVAGRFRNARRSISRPPVTSRAAVAVVSFRGDCFERG